MGVLNQDLVGVDTGEDEVAAVAVEGQGGQGGVVKARRRCFNLPGLEAEFPGGEPYLVAAAAVAGGLEFVDQLVGVGGEAVETGQ